MSFRLDPDHLPPLPQALGDLLALLESPEASPLLIAEKISPEPASTVKVLRMANSPYYGGRGRVSTVGHAVLILGLDTLRSILIAVEGRKALGTPAGLDAGAFWRNAFTLAGLCKWAIRRGATVPANAETGFTTGLLSGVGVFVLPEDARECPESVRAASSALVRHWRLPDEVADAIDGIDSATGRPYRDALILATMCAEGVDSGLAQAESLGLDALDLPRLADCIAEGREAALAPALLLS